MIDREKTELEVLQQLEESSKLNLSPLGDVRCDTVEYEGKRIPVDDFLRLAENVIPLGRGQAKKNLVCIVCGSAEDCKAGKYRPVSERDRLRDDPHCRCYEQLKQQYGDDLPEVAKQYGRGESPKLGVSKD